MSELIDAIESGDIAEVEKLISSGGPNIDIDGYTALIIASDVGNINIVKLLIKSGADPNLTFLEGGENALYYAIFGGHTEVVKLLINAGADVNLYKADGHGITDAGMTVLYNAEQFGETDIVKLLIEANADVNIRNKRGKGPLDNPMVQKIYSEYIIICYYVD